VGIGRSREPRPAVELEAGAPPGAGRCPACGEPLFVWVETEGWGPREDQIVDRCENCGLVLPRGGGVSSEGAVAELLGPAAGRTNGGRGGERTIRAANAASLQAWLGAENWAALRPGTAAIKPTPRAAELLCEKRGLRLARVRHLAGPGIASMWQTLLNLLTFHRDFATEAASGRLRPGTGRGRVAYAIDVIVTVLAAVPTAILAVFLETSALVARRGGVIELRVRPGP
jgi:hypothetical protein